jgi:hypothetical protein
MTFLRPGRRTGVPRLRTIAIVAFTACDGEQARRPLVHTGAIDLETLDAVARLCMGARRSGLVMTVHEPAPELADLLAFVGLNALVDGPDAQSM